MEDGINEARDIAYMGRNVYKTVTGKPEEN
jgi:hypothetical protein